MYRTEARECVVSQDLQTYFRDINEVSLLSAEEERELSEAISRGDEDARTRMIGANLRLVVRIARDYLGRGLVLDDLIGEGNIGLIRAVSEFDPRFGTRFSTYASYWIKQAIRHALINTTATIRLPAHMVGLLTRWRRAERLLTRERGQAPTFDEIAEHLELTETQKGLVAKARRANQLKLESGVGDDEEYWSPDDSIDPAVGPTTALESSDERSDLLRRLDCLDDRERLVVRLRYGLEGVTPLTLKEIGARLGITREWVRKIELRAVNKLEAAAYDTAGAAIPTPKPALARRLTHRKSRQPASNSVRTARPMSFSARPVQVAAAC
jgi:RNA polymerase primary sigma factor